MNRSKLALLIAFSLILPHSTMAATQSKPASEFTKKENAAVLKALPLAIGKILKMHSVALSPSQILSRLKMHRAMSSGI
ncbi:MULTISPECIES: hypothetical protein [unclassified Shewanella]|uniref:hypothetical protein n=1 Tax=unclassified Shewanella TaxID=196818 RepID=UPI001E466984|nr:MULTISPECIES: hypothetical protein [unclassified Shewanella]